ncbi:MAG: DUF2630 family protein [Acidimicrobiales bacterium]|nr:DUF2630 family protein [Acidimicrobiales bacterium]MCB1014355.1 DUF2630 family protein [Acidimicrobiales bacterium]MCB9371802.1 DUF2630 family protein [Microthrixaceae bacterium]
MSDDDILRQISDLAEEERRLEEDPDAPGRDDRLHELQVSQDQSWDLLRQRRAKRNAGLDPDEAEVRSEGVVGRYRQ